MDPILAMIFAFGGNFAPAGYALCNGPLLAISQNTALFSLLGTTYGGDGVQTFALPDLQGRMPIGFGQGAGLSYYTQGVHGGNETTSILTGNLPAHSHQFNTSSMPGNTNTPSGSYLSLAPSTGSGPNAEPLNLYTTNTPNTMSNSGAIGVTGQNSPISILQPYLTICYIIALQGVYPSRN